MEFCKQYNAATENQRGSVIPVEITDLRGPVVHVHPQDAAHAGAAAPGGRHREGLRQLPARSGAGTVTDAQLAEIAQTKMPDLNANDLEAAKRQVAGTARSMGITVE